MSHKAELEALHGRISDLINDELASFQDETMSLRDEAIRRLGAGLRNSGWHLSHHEEAPIWRVTAANGQQIAAGKDLVDMIIRVGEMP